MQVLNIVAIVSILLSLMLSFYLAVKKIKWKWIKSYHHRLVMSLSVLLIFNRSLNLASFIYNWTVVEPLATIYYQQHTLYYNNTLSSEKWSQIEQAYEPVVVGYHMVVGLTYSTFYISLVLLFFITVDHYKRIEMVLPGSLLHSFFRVCQMAAIFQVAYLCFGYIACFFVLPSLGKVPEDFDPVLKTLFSASKEAYEYSIVILCFLVYHVFTIRLVYRCIMSKYGTVNDVVAYMLNIRKKPLEAVSMESLNVKPTLPRAVSVESTAESVDSLSPLALPTSALSNRQTKQDQKRFKLTIRMLALLLVLIFTDVTMMAVAHFAGFLIWFYDLRVALALSWFPVHVMALFALLDALLVELKLVRRVTVSLPSHSPDNQETSVGKPINVLGSSVKGMKSTRRISQSIKHPDASSEVSCSVQTQEDYSTQ